MNRELRDWVLMSKEQMYREIVKLEAQLEEEYRMTNELIGVLDENNIQHFYAKRDMK